MRPTSQRCWMERRVRRAVIDGGAVLGGRGPELDAIVAPIFPRLGPIGGLGVDHDGVATSEKECGRIEGRKGRARKGIEDSSRRPI